MKIPGKEYSAIGARIREARESANMSQKTLADQLGYESATAISLIESGDRKVSVNSLEHIAKLLSRDITFFLGKEEKLDIRHALRASKELSKKEEDEILNFIEFVKSRKNKNERTKS